MKKNLIIFCSVLLLFLAGIYAGKHIFTHKEMHVMSKESSSSGNKSKKEKKILYWQAPMDPAYIRDKPGKSPMGMDLIAVYEGDEQEEKNGLRINPRVVQNMGVRTITVKTRDLKKVIRSLGHLDYDERKIGFITTKIDGWIEQLYLNYTGMEVKKGDPLFDIYSPDLLSAQEELLLATSATGGGKRLESLRKSAERRLRYWDISSSQIKQIIKEKKVRKTLTIYSPFDGVVIHKNINEGAFVKAGTNLYKIADLSTIWVYVHIYEYEMPWIKLGLKAEMELPYVPGSKFMGKVAYIYPFLDNITRDMKVLLEFSNPDMELKPKMYANVRIFSEIRESNIAVPEEAVLDTGLRKIVFISKGNGRFEPRELTLGPEADDGWISVLDGLVPGEKVVTSGQFLLDSESKLREAIQKLLSTEEPSEKTGMTNMDAMDHSKMDRSGMKKDSNSNMDEMDHSGMTDRSGEHADMEHSGMEHNGSQRNINDR